MANTSAVWQHTPTNYHLLTSKQETYQKAYLLTKNTEEFSGKTIRRMGQSKEKREDRQSKSEVGRRTREDTVKWNQMTAIRFQTGRRQETSDIHGLSSGRQQ